MRTITALLICFACTPSSGADPALEPLTDQFQQSVQPFLVKYCNGCHDKVTNKAKLDLSRFTEIRSVRDDLGHWKLVLERLQAEEMPPEDAPRKPPPKQRQAVIRWIQMLRTYEANLNAGDPGLVLARRLSNTEYDYTIRDLTGVDIRPTREFPLDPANEAGFANSGESLTMSPALLDKYLAAAQRVTEHLVLLPTGLAFAPFPALTYSDRDKFAVQRIVDFYLTHNTDYADFLLAGWQLKHRRILGHPDWTVADAAASRNVSHKYLNTLLAILQDDQNHHGPLVELRRRWEALPAPTDPSSEMPVAACQALRDWIVAERGKRAFTFPSVLIPQLNPTTQPGVLWKNRLIADHRRLGTMSDEERQDEDLKVAIERFCDTFPDRFMLTERGRMNLPFEKQNKGRLLGAGFHLQVGYYRDDAPLCDLLLTPDQRAELDAMWGDLVFVTDVLVRQFRDYIYFERAEGREIITAAEFDFARGEDRTVASQETMEKFSKLYVAAVRQRDLADDAIAEIQQYFSTMSKRIRENAQRHEEAQSIHLAAVIAFAGRAWRRPLASQEEARLLEFYRVLRNEDELDHEAAVRDVLLSILISPYFSYRIDRSEPGPDNTRLTGFALANRLSYFLWSSLPDAELMRVAQSGQLHRQAVLIEQARRMLKAPRARALATEFGGNWLGFRQFQNHVGVDRTKFTQFTDALRQSMFQEPVRFIEDLIRRDGSIREFLQATHTYIDPLLAQHYQIPYSAAGADSDGWLRVEDARPYGRGGLLPMAVFLTKNSPGLRTSPVKRGYWVVKQVLGERIPPPPEAVPELPRDEAQLGDKTLRALLRLHRENKSCAACHDKFDFAGLVFEGYGPIGQRRDRDLGDRPVDTQTTFPDGTTGAGLTGLQRYLSGQRQAQFVDNLCRKLLAYGLGRTLILSDDPTIDEMKQTLADHDHRFSSLIDVIVTSRQFLNKRPEQRAVQQQE